MGCEHCAFFLRIVWLFRPTYHGDDGEGVDQVLCTLGLHAVLHRAPDLHSWTDGQTETGHIGTHGHT